MLSETHATRKKSRLNTHNRLLKSSMQFATAFARSTITQTLENAKFFHILLGIKAGLFRFCWACIQKMNAGSRAMLRQSKTMLLAPWIFLTSADRVL